MNNLSKITTEYLQIVAFLAMCVGILVVIIIQIATLIDTHPSSIVGVLSILWLAVIAYRRLEKGYKWAAIVGAMAALMPALTLV